MQIQKYSPQSHKIKALVYGKPWSGKTTFASTAPKAIFASAEGGLLSIASKQPDFVQIATLKDLQDLLHYLKTVKHDYETVIIDSITEINEVIKLEIEKRTGRAIQKNDWVEVQNKIKWVVRGFRDLDMHCLFLALENVEKDEERITAVNPALNGKSATDIAAFMDIVGYIFIDKATGERKIRVGSHNLYLTKDRSNVLPDDPTVDFNDWVEAVKGIKTGELTNVASHEMPRGAADPTDESKELPPAPKKPAPKKDAPKEEAGLSADTRNEFFAVWKELWGLYLSKHTLDRGEDGLLKFAPHTEEATRKTTLVTLYQVDSSTKLTETQAKDFITRMRNKIATLKKVADVKLDEGVEIKDIYATDLAAREQSPAPTETPAAAAPQEEVPNTEDLKDAAQDAPQAETPKKAAK